jgi:hypothetical protein
VFSSLGFQPLASGYYSDVRKGRPLVYQDSDFAPVLSTKMDIRDFPFDSQVLEIVMTSTMWDVGSVRFRFESDADNAAAMNTNIQPEVFNNSEWLFLGTSGEIRDHTYSYVQRYDGYSGAYPHIKIRFHVRRNPWFFVHRIVGVSFLLSIMEGTAFLLPSIDIGNRFAVTGTIFLSLVAFSFVAAGQVPQVGGSC